jgi:uncharacterized membrane protein
MIRGKLSKSVLNFKKTVMKNRQWFILVLIFLSYRGVIAQVGVEQKVDSLLALSKEYRNSGSLKKAKSLYNLAGIYYERKTIFQGNASI